MLEVLKATFMKRKEIQEKLIDFLDQSLSEQEMKEVQEYIDNNEECRRTSRMQVTKQPTIFYITHDVFN